MAMVNPEKRAPKRRDDRVILQFDYDCFYAQVYENRDPALKTKPVGIKQKNILATCNYIARGYGVKKLGLIVEARKICPGLVLLDGEDLTPFRDTSKTLLNFFKSHSWNQKVERLGLDEVFMDVTDIIDYNMGLINKHSLESFFFCLSDKDPEKGFPCDLSKLPGCTEGSPPTTMCLQTVSYLRLLLGSHLGQHLRIKLEQDFGYTSTCGISTNKTLSKLVGARNKPRNQTTLLTFQDDDVKNFMDPLALRNVPGIGFKMASTLETYITGQELTANSHEYDCTVTVGQARSHANISPGSLQRLLEGPGAEKGIGSRIWSLLHGVDPSEVKEANAIPSQISIEDTYKGLETMPQVTEELHKLSCSLVRRLRVDLLIVDDKADQPGALRWLARPKTLRLSIREWPQSGSLYSQSFSRTSRSGSLPSFVFEPEADIEQIAERLVSEALLPLFRRLQGESDHKWNLQLINICAANMVPGAADGKSSVGRDIAHMLRKQDEVLAPWRVIPDADPIASRSDGSGESDFEDADASEGWDTADQTTCPQCGHLTPRFALPAHVRYHEMEE